MSSRTQNKNADLKEDLAQVVTQLNHFRIELVLTKLKSALKRGVQKSLNDALGTIKTFEPPQGQDPTRYTPNRIIQKKTQHYKSPFMQHLAHNIPTNFSLGVTKQQTEFTAGDSICTVVQNVHDQSIVSRPSQEQFKRRSI